MARKKYKCNKLSAAAKSKAIANWRDATGRKNAKRGCKLVVFGRRGCRSAVAIERCGTPAAAKKKAKACRKKHPAGSKKWKSRRAECMKGTMSKAAKTRFRRMKRNQEICLKKRGKRYYFSTKRC